MKNNRITDNYNTRDENISLYIEMAETFAAMSYQGVYLVNLDTGGFVFISDYPLLRCGMSDEELKTRGIEVFSDHIIKEERSLFKGVKDSIESSYKNIPVEFRKRLLIVLNFHILMDRQKTMVCHKLRMLNFNNSGQPHLMLGLVSPSVHANEAVFMAVIPEEGCSFIFNPESKEWNSQTVVNLSNDERTMLRLTMQGHSLEQIGGIMFKSMETIKKALALMVTSAHTLVVYYSCTVQNITLMAFLLCRNILVHVLRTP